MEKKLSIYILLLFAFCAQSCKQDKITIEPAKEVLTTEIPSSFMDFYQKFHANPEFQLEHIIFPLEGQIHNEETGQRVPIKWKKENWVLHRPFDDHGGTFQRNYVNFDDIIIEKISDRSGTFSMERRFSPINGTWHLIYYSEFKMKE